MLFTGIQFRWVDETAKKRMDDVQGQLEQSLIVTAADDNRDGMLQVTELRTGGGDMSELFGQFKANFAQIDADKNSGLDFNEVGAALKQMEEQQRARGRTPQRTSPT
jgi:hypothetical protein